MIEQALRRLYQYCRDNQWKGWDPYDGLSSRLFQSLPFKRSWICRLAWIQLFKQLPVNLRRLAMVPKGENPKGLALFARGLVRLMRAQCDWIVPEDVANLFSRLERLRSPGYEPWCWGYDFDWQNRAFFVRAFEPNGVATIFAAHAFLDRHEMERNPRDLAIARSACTFLLNHLHRPHESSDQVAFSYTPFDRTIVHNVSLLVAALLARVAAAANDSSLADWARRAVAFSLTQQADDGSWPYGTAAFQGWVDHFHTCYNLVSLDDCGRWLQSNAYDHAIERGLDFYLGHLFQEDGLPRDNTQAIYPVDIHAIAVALITLTRFSGRHARCLDLREKIIEWTLDHMQDPRGFFYYQKRAHWLIRTPYMRWAQAWMFYALSMLMCPKI